MSGPEKKVENSIKKYLDSIGAYYVKQHGSAFTKVGIPDILACVNGKFVAIEVKKTGGGVVSEAQKVHIENIIKAGGIAFVADNVEIVKDKLKHIEKKGEM